jgi:quaternary ammonium compound-resistance protein SugE
MAWFYLVIAGLLEVGWAIGLKYTDGFTKLWPSVITVAVMIVSFMFLSQSAKEIPIGTAYAVWAGIGAVGTVLVGMLFMNEPAHALQVAFLLMIVVGILGIKMVS